MKRTLPLLLLILPLLPLTAQVTLISDYTPGPEGSFENPFEVRTQQNAELGDNEGTIIVANKGTGQAILLLADGQLEELATYDDNIGLLTPFGNEVYYTAEDSITGPALYATDGTVAGTRLVVDPDTTTTTGAIVDYKITPAGVIYIGYRDRLYRYENGTNRLLTDNADLGSAFDNEPGSSLTLHEDGVAYYNSSDFRDGGGLYLATDTIQFLAVVPEQSRFGNAFGLRSLRGNLVFSLASTRVEREGTYQYNTTTQTLNRLTDGAGNPLYATRYFNFNDSTAVGLVDNSTYYLLDGSGTATAIQSVGRFSTTARVALPAVPTQDDRLAFLSGGGFGGNTELYLTDGTPDGTTRLASTTTVSNPLVANGHLYFATQRFRNEQHTINRYNLETGGLVQLVELPNVARDNVQLLTVQGDQLYFTYTLDEATGKELYALPTGVINSVYASRLSVIPLDIHTTANTFLINQPSTQPATLTVYDLNGRIIHGARKIPTQTAFPYLPGCGLHIYHFALNGRVAVRKIVRQ